MTNSGVMEDTISELFDSYNNKALKPSLESVYQVAKGYFSEFKENYLKLKCMFKSIKHDKEEGLTVKV